jgi:hypothetical protein
MLRFTLAAALAAICVSPAIAGTPRGLLWPAQNFSAYYYRSPGGIGRPCPGPAFYAPKRRASASSVPYLQSCGGGRHWDGARCVEGSK